jgi:hypothetical protein
LVVACLLLKLVAGISSHLVFRGLVVLAAMGWSIYGTTLPMLSKQVASHFRLSAASIGFIANQSPVKRRALVLYPIVLYYIVIGWLVLNDNHSSAPSANQMPTTIAPTPATSTLDL